MSIQNIQNKRKIFLPIVFILGLFGILLGVILKTQTGAFYLTPTAILVGLADGINPCAIGVMIFLLGYLIVFAERPEKILPIGTTYILTVYLTYLLAGLIFYRFVFWLTGTSFHPVFHNVLGGAIILAALINIKDFFAPGWGFSLQIPLATRKTIQNLVERITLPATALLAFVVTLCEIPCSLPLYIGTINIFARSGLELIGIFLYLLLYNLMFVLPLILILLLVWSEKKIVFLKEWEHKNKRLMKLIMGIALLIIGIWILI